MIDLQADIADLFLDAQRIVADRIRAWACRRHWSRDRHAINARDGWPEWNGVTYHARDGFIIRPIAPIQDRYERQRKGPRREDAA